MQSQLFNCPICYVEFNNEDRKPKILPLCGHTICLVCLENILKMHKSSCPLDRKLLEKKIDNYSTNIIMLQLIEEKAQLVSQGCPLHNEPNNMICLEDKSIVCKYCADYGDHKGHKVKHLNDVQKEASIKRKNLKEMIDVLEKEEQTIYGELEESRSSLLLENKKRFGFLRDEINRMEQESFHCIQESFAFKKLEISQKLKSHRKAKETLQKKAQDLGEISNTEVFLKAFGEESHELIESIEKQITKDALFAEVEDFKKDFKGGLGELEEKFSTLLKEHQQRAKLQPVLNFEDKDFFKTLRLSKKADRLVLSPLLEGEKPCLLELPETCDKISLNFSQGVLDDDYILAVSSLWKKMGKVEDVRIDVSHKDTPVSELLDFCSYLFYVISGAEKVELGLASCGVTDNHFEDILYTKFGFLKDLKGIRLQFRGTKITDKSIIRLSEFISSRKNPIESFYLNGSQTQISDAPMKELFSSFKPNMKGFALVMNSTQISDKTVALLNQYILPLSESWNSLSFHFFETKVSDASIEELLLSLKLKAPTLKNFNFEVGRTKVTERSIQTLISDVLPMFCNLETFQLGAAALKLDAVLIQNLMGAFDCDPFKNLEYFALSLDNTEFSNKHLEFFAKNILVHMNKVESLILTLTGASLSDAGLEPFFLALRNIAKQIKFFNLRIVRNFQVSDQSIELFDKQVFPLLTNLETFSFQATQTQITDHGKNLLAAMEKHVSSK